MTNYINNEAVEKVKESANIVDIVSDYIDLKRSGSNYVGLCPFHSEKTPSFTVSDSKQFYHCFGCGVSGDSINFIMKRENLDFPGAVKFLADKLGIEVEETKVDPHYQKERDTAYEINRDAARFFFNSLTQNKAALNYLQKRQMSAKIVRQFGLGYAPDSWDALFNHLLEKGHKAEEIEELGLIGKKSGNTGYYDKFRNRIIFPIIDTKSRVIGFGGRVLDHTMPKYLNSRESIIFSKGNHLYGLNLVNKHSNREKILLVEGYMDVISLFTKGLTYSVASLGTALTPQQGKLLKRYGREIYICFDSDTAGTKATLKAIGILLNLDLKPKVIILPKEMDPDDYINKFGLLEFETLMVKALNHMDYRISVVRRKYDLDNTEEKIKYGIEVSQLIKTLKSPVEQDIYIDKVSKEADINREAIENEVRGIRNKSFSPRFNPKKQPPVDFKNIEPIRSTITSGHLRAELDLMRIMIEDIDYFEIVNRKLVKDDFSSEELKNLYDLISLQYSFQEKLNLKDIQNEAISRHIPQDLINSLFEEEIEYNPTDLGGVVEDLVNRIILNKLVNERKNIIKKIEDAEKGLNKEIGEDLNISELFMKLTNLNIEIKIINKE